MTGRFTFSIDSPLWLNITLAVLSIAGVLYLMCARSESKTETEG